MRSVQGDPWKVLGLPRTATPVEIGRRFRELAAIHHTDRGQDAKYREITAAYALLKDPNAVQEFLLKEAAAVVAWLLENPDVVQPPRPVADSYEVVRVPFLLALRGGPIATRWGLLPVPRGAETGAPLIITGRHEGQLRVSLEVQPHRLLRRDGLDLDLEVRLSSLEAYRGGPLSLPTPWGAAPVRLTPNTLRTGDRIVLQGYGVRCAHDVPHGPPARNCKCPLGHLRVRVSVDPLPSSAALLALLQQLARDEHPRAGLMEALT